MMVLKVCVVVVPSVTSMSRLLLFSAISSARNKRFTQTSNVSTLIAQLHKMYQQIPQKRLIESRFIIVRYPINGNPAFHLSI